MQHSCKKCGKVFLSTQLIDLMNHEEDGKIVWGPIQEIDLARKVMKRYAPCRLLCMGEESGPPADGFMMPLPPPSNEKPKGIFKPLPPPF